MLLLHDEARIDQRGQMMRKRRRREAEMFADVTDTQPVFACLYQKAEDGKARIMAKGVGSAALGGGKMGGGGKTGAVGKAKGAVVKSRFADFLTRYK